MTSRTFVAIGLLAFSLALPVGAANILVYGPSLAPNNCATPDESLAQYLHPEGGCDPNPLPLVNEATVAADNGHNVTVVDEATWSSMSQGQFAAFDAIVIGDAGCDYSNGEDLDAVDANKAIWSPVVTGNITINGFDAFYHYYQNALSTAGARALAGNGIDFAASGSGTGLYYSAGCRSFGDLEGGTIIPIDFLSGIGSFEADTDGGGDAILIEQPGHPAIVDATEENLSDWGSSTHTVFTSWPGSFDVLATVDNDGGPEGGGISGPVILATEGRVTPLAVPTLSTWSLAGFALALGGLALWALGRRRTA